MKLLSTYFKEMLIAARGFYFYIEIAIAILLLVILMVAINPDDPGDGQVEFLYNEVPSQLVQAQLEQEEAAGTLRFVEPKEWTLGASDLTLTHRRSGTTTSYSFAEEKSISVPAYQRLDPETGRVLQTVYQVPSFDDLLRLSHQEQTLAAFTYLGDDGRINYQYFLMGYETGDTIEALYVIHNDDPEVLRAQIDQQRFVELESSERLNGRQDVIPVFLTFAGSLMGFFIVISYIFLDKSEGVIKAFAVSPSSITSYLMSKAMVIMTNTLISSAIIAIPVMGAGPNYGTLLLFILSTNFAFSTLGLLVASFFDSIGKSFGVLYGLMIAFMLPAFSYYIPGFDPLWLRVFPTYPVLQGYKDALLGTADQSYVLLYSGVFVAAGIILLSLARWRFKKSLTV